MGKKKNEILHLRDKTGGQKYKESSNRNVKTKMRMRIEKVKLK